MIFVFKCIVGNYLQIKCSISWKGNKMQIFLKNYFSYQRFLSCSYGQNFEEEK